MKQSIEDEKWEIKMEYMNFTLLEAVLEVYVQTSKNMKLQNHLFSFGIIFSGNSEMKYNQKPLFNAIRLDSTYIYMLFPTLPFHKSYPTCCSSHTTTYISMTDWKYSEERERTRETTKKKWPEKKIVRIISNISTCFLDNYLYKCMQWPMWHNMHQYALTLMLWFSGMCNFAIDVKLLYSHTLLEQSVNASRKYRRVNQNICTCVCVCYRVSISSYILQFVTVWFSSGKSKNFQVIGE